MTTAGHATNEGTTQARGLSWFRKALGGISRVLDSWRNFVQSEVIAEGYEDENGFHYGKRPHPNCVNLDQYSRRPEERRAFEQTKTVVAISEQQKLAPSIAHSYLPVPERKK